MTTLHRLRWPSLAAVALAGLLPLLAQQPSAGKRYAVLVGVKEYNHARLKPLEYSENDVDELAALLRPAGYEVVLLSNSAGRRDPRLVPTLANIEARLGEVLEKCNRHDTVLVALAGHGLHFDRARPTDPDDSYFCPQDARPLADRRETLLSLTRLYRRLDESGAGVKLLLVDACRDDPTPGRGRGVDGSTAPRPPQGVAALFSCKAGERAFESDKLRHGVFFHYVLEGLRGQAKNADDEVTWDALQQYVRTRVSRDVGKLIGNVRQTPTLNAGELAGEPPVLLTVKRAGTLTVDLGGGVKLEMVRIPAGTFTMGSPPDEKDRATDEEPHEVVLTQPFYLGKYEVTQAQYAQVMGTNPSYFSRTGAGKDEVKDLDTSLFPVENVSWDDAVAFCRKLTELPESRSAGRTYRLPTEAEWEYSCRGGAVSPVPYHFGTSLSSRQANMGGRDANGPYLDRTCAVGSYPPNAFGLYDMHGNVWEWCADWYGAYPGGRQTDPTGPKEGSDRVYRGGSWINLAGVCRSAYRRRNEPGNRDFSRGFRLALSSVR